MYCLHIVVLKVFFGSGMNLTIEIGLLYWMYMMRDSYKTQCTVCILPFQ